MMTSLRAIAAASALITHMTRRSVPNERLFQGQPNVLTPANVEETAEVFAWTPTRAESTNTPSTQAEGLRALCITSESLPGLCHNALYEIYVGGQYVESVGNKGPNAARALEFYRRKRRKQIVEVRVQGCRVTGCDRGQS